MEAKQKSIMTMKEPTSFNIEGHELKDNLEHRCILILSFLGYLLKGKKKLFWRLLLSIKITHLETHSLTYFYWGVRTVLYC